MRTFATLLMLVSLVHGVAQASQTEKDQQFDRLSSCLTKQDYRCAFDAASRLAETNNVAVGYDRRTTDSMMVYQTAFIEAVFAANSVERIELSVKPVRHFSETRARLPFVFGFGALVLVDEMAKRDSSSTVLAKRTDAFCRATVDTPPPSWRAIRGVPTLSDEAKVYFQDLWNARPNCELSTLFKAFNCAGNGDAVCAFELYLSELTTNEVLRDRVGKREAGYFPMLLEESFVSAVKLSDSEDKMKMAYAFRASLDKSLPSTPFFHAEIDLTIADVCEEKVDQNCTEEITKRICANSGKYAAPFAVRYKNQDAVKRMLNHMGEC